MNKFFKNLAGILLKNTSIKTCKRSWLWHNMRRKGLQFRVIEGKIQGTWKRGHPRNSFITQACRDIGVQTYVELEKKLPESRWWRRDMIKQIQYQSWDWINWLWWGSFSNHYYHHSFFRSWYWFLIKNWDQFSQSESHVLMTLWHIGFFSNWAWLSWVEIVDSSSLSFFSCLKRSLYIMCMCRTTKVLISRIPNSTLSQDLTCSVVLKNILKIPYY